MPRPAYARLAVLLLTAAPAFAVAQPAPPAVRLSGGETGAIELPTVDVEGRLARSTSVMGQPPPAYPGGQVGSGTRVGLLGNQSVFDTPFNSTSFTSELNRNQQNRAIADVVLNDPSVQLGLPRSGPQDQFVIRGFRAFQQDILFDGLGGIVSYRRPAIDNIERVEILKGPTALLNGVTVNGNIGGLITFVPKRATDEPITRYTLGYASQAEFGNYVDVGRRFGANKEWGVRFNGTYRDGKGEIDRSSLRYGFGSLGLDYRGERVRVSADLGYQAEENRSFQTLRTVVPGIPIPKAPRARNNLNQPWELGDNQHVFGATRAEFDVTDRLTVYAAYGRSNNKDLRFNATQQILNAQGDFRQNGFFYEPFDVTSSGYDVGARALIDTGPIRHKLVVSTSAVQQETDYFSNRIPLVVLSNIYDPVRVPRPDTSGVIRTPGRSGFTRARGVAVADVMSALDERVILTVGGRYQEIFTRAFSITPGADFGTETARYEANKLTPAVALVVKPTQRLSLYGNYIEGLQAGPTAPTTVVNPGQLFPPFTARQVEFGAKYDFGQVGVAASVFEITQQSAFTDPLTNRFGVDGEQRNRGVELNVFGEPLPGVRLIGGGVLLDGTLTKTAGGTLNGRTAPGVPDYQFSLYGEYDLPRSLIEGVTLTGRVLHSGRQFYNQANTQRIPASTRFDLGARFAVQAPYGKPIVLRANVENVLDANYYQTAINGLLSQGSARTFLLSTQFDF